MDQRADKVKARGSRARRAKDASGFGHGFGHVHEHENEHVHDDEHDADPAYFLCPRGT